MGSLDTSMTGFTAVEKVPAEDGQWLQEVNLGEGIGSGEKHEFIQANSHSPEVLFSSSVPCLKGFYIRLSEANLDIA